MKAFKDLYLRGSMSQLTYFMSKINDFTSDGWQLGDDNKFKENFIVLQYIGDVVNKASVFIWIKDRGNGEFRVTNIVPMEKNSLNYDEYNEILVKCAVDCIIPCAEHVGLNNTITSEDVDIEDYMSPLTVEKLRDFSAAANKSTGSSHPYDNERWNDFICKAYIDGHERVVSILGRWLLEDGWDEEMAFELSIEFEQGIAVLSHYQEKYNG